MAWYNPATWTVVDNLQGQNNDPSGGGGGGGVWGDTTQPSWNQPGGASYDPNSTALPPYAPSPTPYTYDNSGGSQIGVGNNQADYINKSYDTKIAGLRSIFDTYNPQEDAANLNVLNQYQNQANNLQVQKATGDRNLSAATQQVNDSKVRSLADLARQISTMGRSYANQLGSYGAGDSSANGMINQALSGMASRNRSNVLYDAANQQRGIDMQGQSLQDEYQTNLKALDDWKANNLNDIATRFLQARQAIQQQMIGADQDRYNALAQMDSSYAQQAIQKLSELENSYKQNAQDLIGRYQNINGPNVQINPALQQYAVAPISAGKIAQLSTVPSVSNGSNPTPLAQRRPFQQDYGYSF